MTMTRHEQQLKAVETEMQRYSQEAQDIWKKAEDEDRDTSNEERGEVEKKLKAIETLKVKKEELEEAIKVEKDVVAVGKAIGTAQPIISPNGDANYPQPKRAKSLGEQFVESEGYKRLKAQGVTGSWTTGQVDLSLDGIQTKTLLDSGASSGGDLILPDNRPGLTQVLFERLTIADLMASGTTSSNTVHYMKEITATNSAAAVAEGAAKPESALAFDAVDEPVRKIATWLPVTDEMLEDAEQIQSYINARLSLFVQIKEEQQLLAGDGTAPNISGILDRTGIQTQARGSDTNEVAIFKALNKVRATFLEPDAIVIHPDNYTTIRLRTDSNNQYMGGGPFLGPYGGPQGPVSGNYYQSDPIWGKRVVVTSAITANTALVGAFATAAQVFRRSGLSVEASNSHDTYFVLNKTAIRAEERLALAVYRESAFCSCTGLN